VPWRDEDNVGGPQRLPGRPAEQAGGYPRAGSQDDQQAGAVATGDADVNGPWLLVTADGAVTT
jgi:hypothetical protein